MTFPWSGPIRHHTSDQITGLQTVADLCGVSRARVSTVVCLLGMAGARQERVVGMAWPPPDPSPAFERGE